MHRDFIVQKPVFDQSIPGNQAGLVGCVNFDRGAKLREGRGSEGFVGWNCEGECVGGKGRYYGPLTPTGSEAEARAMVECVEWALSVPELTCNGGLAIFGDSSLCIAFMQKRFRPGKPELA